jgi:hypothetical protein
LHATGSVSALIGTERCGHYFWKNALTTSLLNEKRRGLKNIYHELCLIDHLFGSSACTFEFSSEIDLHLLCNLAHNGCLFLGLRGMISLANQNGCTHRIVFGQLIVQHNIE